MKLRNAHIAAVSLIKYPMSSSWQSAQTILGDSSILPVILLPAGHEIELIGSLVGKAFFVAATELPLRAALLGRASLLISDDPATVELSGLMDTPVVNLPASKNSS